MPFPCEKIVLSTPYSNEQILEKLRGAVFLVKTFSYPSADSLSEIRQKSFVGSIHGQKFKILLRGDIGRKINVSRGQVVVVGEMDGSTVKMLLRPPLFTLVFLLLWCAFTGLGFVLSFFGTAGAGPRALIAGMFLLPLAVVVPFFNHEAKTVRETLKQVFGQGQEI
jgi:hypothetical protein